MQHGWKSWKSEENKEIVFLKIELGNEGVI